MALGILEQLEAQGLTRPLHEMIHNSTEYLHTLIEALRSADTLYMPSLSEQVGRHSLAFTGVVRQSEYLSDSDTEQILCGTFLIRIRERSPSGNSWERYKLFHRTLRASLTDTFRSIWPGVRNFSTHRGPPDLTM